MSPPTPVEAAPVTKLYQFRPGDVVIMECDLVFSAETERLFRENLKAVAPELRFVVLTPGMRVVGRCGVPITRCTSQGGGDGWVERCILEEGHAGACKF